MLLEVLPPLLPSLFLNLPLLLFLTCLSSRFPRLLILLQDLLLKDLINVTYLAITEEVANKQRSAARLCLLLGLLDDPLSLLLLRLFNFQIFHVLVALEVVSLFLERVVVGKMPFATEDDQEIFPVLYDDDDEDDELDGADSCKCCQGICLLPSILINKPLLALYNEIDGEGGYKQSHGADYYFVLQLSKMRLLPSGLNAIFVHRHFKERKQGRLDQVRRPQSWFIICRLFLRKDLLDCLLHSHQLRLLLFALEI